MRCFIIAEAGVNHNGSARLAHKLIDVAADAGADAVKFQTFRADTVIGPGVAKAEYQRVQTGDGDQYSMIKELELPFELHVKLLEHCQARNIEFISTPFDCNAANYLVSLGVRRLKVASGELTNLPFLEHLATFGLPLIISTGMADLGEVAEAVETVDRVRRSRGFSGPLSHFLTLLHCTSNYPAELEDVNLRAMQTLASEFGLPVGYSDHSLGTLVAPVAVAMGATVIEKHFTLDRSLSGPDHKTSLEPAELARMIQDIRAIERALGSGEKRPRPSELPVRDLVRRSLVVCRDLPAGAQLSKEDLMLLRPGTGIPPKHLPEVVGRRLTCAVTAGTLLNWEHLAP